MLCWCQRAACSITFITRHVAGHSSDGTKLALQRARNVICKCAALQCCCHAVFHCSLALSLFAVQSTLKVREKLRFNATDASHFRMSHGGGLKTRSSRFHNKLSRTKNVYHSIYFLSHRRDWNSMWKIYFDNIFHLFVWHFSIYFRISLPSSAIKVLLNFSPHSFISLWWENRFLGFSHVVESNCNLKRYLLAFRNSIW